MDAGRSRALVSVSKAMLEQPYYARYELIELGVPDARVARASARAAACGVRRGKTGTACC